MIGQRPAPYLILLVLVVAAAAFTPPVALSASTALPVVGAAYLVLLVLATLVTLGIRAGTMM